ncbi:hypothetical protein [Rhodoferax sp. TS-BS-61-7]|uniref:hypothetical protein n=1 Tax=Rhodoferax sp. TS-BS-61-7 TaxID=2094194 RepID=UPI000CF71E97|nr:hypothetical protein [Rhodoferax sp. TS-BS-61-7]PQA78364.1 hypothetical protein C5F53_08600 [Rhodoferax sp. TS-BS-61-7]
MGSDVNARLSQLRSRRKGETTGIALDSLNKSYTADALDIEDWERRGSASQHWTRYAIGAMQSVGKKYTEVSVTTGNRVADQLRERLAKVNIDAVFKLQGSVPLDVHIRRVSDVDVLAITTEFLTYRVSGVKSKRGGYSSPSPRSSSEVLRELRIQIEADLDNAFPSAKVDKTGAKAVKVSGASLPRSVDVVPGHWHDTEAYQESGRQADRAVKIYNKRTGETIENLPFLHIERVASRCDSIKGGLRKAIRLCKNVKADADRDIQLSSYDIAAVMYHADTNALRMGQFSELAVLSETQRHLDALYRDQDTARKLLVPDGSRAIFDSAEKIGWLYQLSLEMDELLDNVYQECFPYMASSGVMRSAKRSSINTLAV